MKTPAGKECRYYYEDFHRGRSRQECRLLLSKAWRPSDCRRCPVPEILWANASEYLELQARIERGFIFGLGRRVVVTARCRKHDVEIPDPYVGCELCAAERPDLLTFLERGES
ncbi:MAG TPA: hypothetical protein ENI95_08305 [Chloroflexi bacterium]|nr:hypothetical protein [Chloroflexota bacterium]